MKIGVPYEVFWKLSPYEFEIIFDGYIEQQKQINYMNWINGGYTLSALTSALSQVFGKKGSKGVDYIKKPLPIYETEEKELTEEQKVEEQEKILHMLQAMQVSFEASHPKDKNENN